MVAGERVGDRRGTAGGRAPIVGSGRVEAVLDGESTLTRGERSGEVDHVHAAVLISSADKDRRDRGVAPEHLPVRPSDVAVDTRVDRPATDLAYPRGGVDEGEVRLGRHRTSRVVRFQGGRGGRGVRGLYIFGLSMTGELHDRHTTNNT